MSREKFGEQRFGGNNQLMAKLHLRKESREDNACRGSARESASTSASAERDVGLEV